MKRFIILLIPLLLQGLFSCNENKSETNSSSNISQQTSPPIPTADVQVPNNDSTKILKFFIKAKSGLNYRATPNGKVPGKFPLNSEVEVVKHTGVFEEIKDGNDLVKGEWVGVQNGKDVVYVFKAFLSTTKVKVDLGENNSLEEEQKTFYPINIYQLYEYEKKKGESTLFVSLSDSHP